jgi:hypothetical protein
MINHNHSQVFLFCLIFFKIFAATSFVVALLFSVWFRVNFVRGLLCKHGWRMDRKGVFLVRFPHSLFTLSIALVVLDLINTISAIVLMYPIGMFRCPLEDHSTVPPCRFFQLGKCIYGENCRYLLVSEQV